MSGGSSVGRAYEASCDESREGDFERYADSIARFVVGYHKSVVMSSVTGSSLDIIDESLGGISGALSSIVASFEEIRATSSSTASNSERIEGMVQEIVAKNASMGKDIERRAGEVREAAIEAEGLSRLYSDLDEKSRSIAGMTSSIRDLSERTNILAINASIEAARAGSVGKGFRIIANEVRTLASQTDDFAQKIDATIKDFAQAVALISGKMGSFKRLLEALNASFKEINANFEENSSAYGESSGLLAQIAQATKEETIALTDGLSSLSRISDSLKDTHNVFQALRKGHEGLDTLLASEA
jgi:methyl-accepting chemotaxis protein